MPFFLAILRICWFCLCKFSKCFCSFHRIGPLGQFGLVVAMSVFMFIYRYVSFPYNFLEASHWPSDHMEGGGGEKEEAISPFFDASGNKNIGASICIGQEILCLPYAGFFQVIFVLKNLGHVDKSGNRGNYLQTS